MSVLSSVVIVFKAIAKCLGISARTWQPSSNPSTDNKHSKSGGSPLPNRDETAPGKNDSNLPRLPEIDNKGESSDRHAGLSEDQEPSESFDGDPLSIVTKTGPEVDISEPADSGLSDVSSDSDEIRRSEPSSTVVEPTSSDASIPLVAVLDEGRPARQDRIPDSDDPDGNVDLNKSPEVQRKPRGKPREISGRRSRAPRRLSNEPRVPRVPRPELLCYKSRVGGMWEVEMSVDEEIPIEAVYLQSKKLEFANNKCRIPSLTGQLAIEYQDGRKQDVSLFEREPLIFKLRKDWAGSGRKIAAITSGYFIVIAPKAWNRKGQMPVAPQRCRDAEFRAHYFFREGQSEDEHIGGFLECEDFHVVTGIKLSGQRVFDDSEEGDLFVQRVPELMVTQDIVWARVGEEAKSGWKGQNFEPAKQTLSETLNGREGRFFLRVYDSNGKLLDSTEFRFLKGLKHICVNGEPYTKHTMLLPDLNGHPPTEVRFVGVDDSKSPQIKLCESTQATVKSGVLSVDQSPEANCVLCTLGSGNDGVKIKLDLPRTWWKMVSGDNVQCEWRDKPVKMTRQEFQEFANGGSEIRLLQKRPQSIRVGFDDELNLNYRRSKKEHTIPIPLIEFVDHEQIDQRLSTEAQLKVELAGTALPIIVISADPLPKIESFNASPMRILKGEEAILRWVTSEANQAQVTVTPGIGLVESEGHCIVCPIETTAYTLSLVAYDTYRVERVVTVNVDLPDGPVEYLRPRARGFSLPPPRLSRSAKHLGPRARRHNGGGWRDAKGFSYNEVQCAGLTLGDANRHSIRLDTRRRSVHQINVQALKTLLNE